MTVPEPLSPKLYADVFEADNRGSAILDELIRRFGGNPYVRGGHEAERETTFRAGSNQVVQFILGRINQANGVDDNAEE